MDDKTVKNAFKLNKVLWNYNAKKKKQKDTKKTSGTFNGEW